MKIKTEVLQVGKMTIHSLYEDYESLYHPLMYRNSFWWTFLEGITEIL
jgi:hypothetical protein